MDDPTAGIPFHIEVYDKASGRRVRAYIPDDGLVVAVPLGEEGAPLPDAPAVTFDEGESRVIRACFADGFRQAMEANRGEPMP